MASNKARTEQKRASKPDSLTKTSGKEKAELEEKDLNEVTGGSTTMSDFHFTQSSNKATP